MRQIFICCLRATKFAGQRLLICLPIVLLCEAILDFLFYKKNSYYLKASRFEFRTEMSVKTQPGGMFNSYKVQYSPETHRLLKVLMDEVKLTTALRSQMKESLKRGEPLPVLKKQSRQKQSFVDENLFDMKKNGYFLRRSRDQIIHSGAYERERYRFLGRAVDLEREKEKLQNIMSNGKNVKKSGDEASAREKSSNKSSSKKFISPEERMEELVLEIEERVGFLNEMKSLGQIKKYESTMKQEIAQKLREMERIDKESARKYAQLLEPERTSMTKRQFGFSKQ